MELVLPCWELLLHSSSPVGASPRVSWVGPDGLAPGHEWALGGQLLGRGVMGLLAALGLPRVWAGPVLQGGGRRRGRVSQGAKSSSDSPCGQVVSPEGAPSPVWRLVTYSWAAS